MNYTLHLKTQYSESFSHTEERPNEPKIVFSYNAKEKYPQLLYKDIDLTDILNKAKTRFNLSKKRSDSWENFKKNIPAEIHDGVTINKSAVAKKDIFANNYKGAIDNLLFSNDESISNKEYKTFLPTLKYELKEYLRKNKSSDKFDEYYQHLNSHLPNYIKQMLEFEKTLTKSENFYKHQSLFKKTYSVLSPILHSIYKTTSYKTLNIYKFEMSYMVEKLSESREKNDGFIPVGMCHFWEKLFINTANTTNSSRIGYASLNKERLIGIFLHELGHAVDYPFEDAPLLKHNGKIKREETISETDEFCKNTLKAYRRSRVLPFKHRRGINYFCGPESKFIDLENFEPMENGATFYRDWDRPQQEAWAESFAILSRWFWNGFNQLDVVTLKCKKSIDRSTIKTLMPTINYMLDNLNWQYIGLSDKLYTKRKNQIKMFLKKIDRTPIIINNSSIKIRSCGKLNQVKKPILRELLNK